MGQNFLCGHQLWRKFFFCSPLPTLCDPKFYPSPRAILGGTSLFEAFFPPSGKKSVPMCADVSGIRVGSNRGQYTQKNSRHCHPTLCCLSGSVQLSSVLARVPRVLGGGLLSHWCRHRSLTLKSLDGRALGSLRVAPEAQNP